MKRTLSSREQQVMDMLCTGKTPKQIAFAFQMSLNTVYSHINRCCLKLNAKNRDEAMTLHEQAKCSPKP